MSPAKAGPPDTRSAKTRDRLLQALTPVVQGEGYDLEELAVRSVGRRSLVRVVVDADGGVDLDTVATLSRRLSDELDQLDADGAGFSEPFVLEVTSPGIDRPLTEPRHWRRAATRLVKVDVAGVSTTARVLSADDAAVLFAPADAAGEARRVLLADLGPGRVQIEFNRVDAPADDVLDDQPADEHEDHFEDDVEEGFDDEAEDDEAEDGADDDIEDGAEDDEGTEDI